MTGYKLLVLQGSFGEVQNELNYKCRTEKLRVHSFKEGDVILTSRSTNMNETVRRYVFLLEPAEAALQNSVKGLDHQLGPDFYPLPVRVGEARPLTEKRVMWVGGTPTNAREDDSWRPE